MNPDSSSHSELLKLSRSYRTALKKHLEDGAGSDLKPAHKLGHRALHLGIDILSLAKVHEDALVGLEANGSSARTKSARLRRSRAFFSAAVSPLGENHPSAAGTNGGFEKTIKSLKRRTEELAATNSELREEIARRKAVEESLRTSETTTSLLLKKSRKLEEELRLLSRRLLTVQEDERRRISRELHDVIAQNLAGINVRLAVLRSQTSANAKDFHERIEVTERLVEQSVEIVHRFAFDLRPLVLDDLGLIPALQSHLTSFEERTGIPTSLTAVAAVETLDASGRTALFRIAQEALANIAHHAKASRVTIALSRENACLRMKIRDDGRGFDLRGQRPSPGPGRLGLLGMRERAEMVGGSFRIDSKVGEGTTVWVEIPLEETATAPGPLPAAQASAPTKPL